METNLKTQLNAILSSTVKAHRSLWEIIEEEQEIFDCLPERLQNNPRRVDMANRIEKLNEAFLAMERAEVILRGQLM